MNKIKLTSFYFLCLAFSFHAQVNWKSISSKGMGYVDGLIIHPQSNIKYVRTDVGGIFKFNISSQDWSNLTDTLQTLNRIGLNCVETFAVDFNTIGGNQVLYALCGNGAKSYMLKSTNDGQSWTINQGWQDSIKVYGNSAWRCAGERLAIDPNNSNIVYCGTRLNGLYKTDNAAQQWNKVSSFTAQGGKGGLETNGGISFVVFDSSTTTTINSQTVSKNIYIGLIDGGIYRSDNGGVSWNYLTNGFDTGLYNPVRAVFNNNRLIIALMQDGDQYNDGEIWQFTPNNNNSSGTWANKTPGLQNNYTCPVWGKYMYNAVAVKQNSPNTVYIASRGGTPGKIFYTNNFNATFPNWKILALEDSSGYLSCLSNYKRSVFKTPPSWVNTQGFDWVGNIEFDKTDTNRLWLSSGNGVMVAEDVNATPVIINSQNTMKGLEILCVNQIVSPPLPNTTPMIAGVMDILGMRFQNLNNGNLSKLDTSFGLGAGVSLAYSFQNPNTMALVGQDYFDPTSINRKIKSNDGGITWQSFYTVANTCNDAPYGGNIAISATNTNNMIWVPNFTSTKSGCSQPIKNQPRYTQDGGTTWNFCNNINFPAGNFPFTFDSRFAIGKSLESDKVNGNKFYYFAMQGTTFVTQLWRTTDGGANWTSMSTGVMPITGSGQLKANPFVEDDIWFSPFNNYILENDTSPNLRKLYHSTDGGATWNPLTGISEVYAFGFGMKALGSNNPALIVYGKINNIESIYVSNDMGVTFTNLGSNNIPEGIIGNIEGDMKVNGRIYIATGCRGSWYGDVSNISTKEGNKFLNMVNDFEISPNPANDYFKLTIPFDIENKKTVLKVYDMLGREIKLITLKSTLDKINVNTLKKGLYIVELISDSKKLAAKLAIE
jgi:xyloglucan-specific exo-beta-1,4-glucanase